MLENKQLIAVIEGLLFVSGDEGMTLKELVTILDVPQNTVLQLIEQLAINLQDDDSRGMTIMQAQDAYHLTTKKEHSTYYNKLIETPRTNRLSQSALETLAIIAYKQPITRVEIEDIRGVNSDRAVQTLMSRSLVEEKGRKDTIGRPIMFGTTPQFLTYFGLASLDDLPPLPNEIDGVTVEDEADLFLDQFRSSDMS